MNNTPINCQSDNIVFQTYDLNTFWVTCGYWYDSFEAWSVVPQIVVPPDPPLVAVPEPASWLLLLAGMSLIPIRLWRARK